MSFAGCETAEGRRAAPATSRAASDHASGKAAHTATVDDTTNGLTGFSSFGPDGEARGRTENFFFADTNDDGLPDRRVPTERLLVYQGSVLVEVARPDEVMANFRTQVAAWGGHLQSQQDQTLVVRVPTSHFEDAFTWVKQSGHLLSESRKAADVTEEVFDLGIRLENARKSRDRLLEVLQKADKVEDILKVEAELRRLTEEIERMEGRQKLLADQVAMATLEARFQALTGAPGNQRARQPSRFAWINGIGAEAVMEDF